MSQWHRAPAFVVAGRASRSWIQDTDTTTSNHGVLSQDSGDLSFCMSTRYVPVEEGLADIGSLTQVTPKVPEMSAGLVVRSPPTMSPYQAVRLPLCRES
ncbi:hypothetical protein ACWCQK_34950 [Streptomyces sp. NPDC002306]